MKCTMKIKLTYLLIIFGIFNSYSQSVEIPKGVNYHKTSEANNKEAKKLIQEAIVSKDFRPIFETTVMIGPNLWTSYLRNYSEANPEGGINLNFKIPIEKKIITRKGRIIKQNEEFNLMWNFISDNLNGGKIRVPKKSEIEYYWSIIAYDIEEPLYVMEFKHTKILFNFNPTNNKLLFMELL